LGMASWVMAMRGNAAEAWFDLGCWDEAAGLFAGDSTGGESPVSVLMEVSVRVRLGIGRGEFDEAARQLQRSTELIERVVDPQFIGPHYRYSALQARWLDRPEEALTWVRTGLERLVGSEDRFYIDPLDEAGIAAVGDLVERGDAGEGLIVEAEGWWENLAAQQPGGGETHARRATAFAELGRATSVDHPDRWRAAAAAWEELGRPYEVAYARWRFAIAARSSGEAGDEAAEALGLAASTARTLGATPLLEKIEAMSTG